MLCVMDTRVQLYKQCESCFLPPVTSGSQEAGSSQPARVTAEAARAELEAIQLGTSFTAESSGLDQLIEAVKGDGVFIDVEDVDVQNAILVAYREKFKVGNDWKNYVGKENKSARIMQTAGFSLEASKKKAALAAAAAAVAES